MNDDLIRTYCVLQTSTELEQTVDKCEKLQAKSDEVHTKAEAEREYMKEELISLNKDYKKIRPVTS